MLPIPTVLAVLAAIGGAFASLAWADFTTSGKPPGKVTVEQTADGGTLTVTLAGGNPGAGTFNNPFGPTPPFPLKVKSLP